jgi:hypothetical protein
MPSVFRIQVTSVDYFSPSEPKNHADAAFVTIFKSFMVAMQIQIESYTDQIAQYGQEAGRCQQRSEISVMVHSHTSKK